MAAVAILGLGIVGWINAPVRPEPFDEPLPPLSLGWWLYTPVDPGIADLDMVPAGGFGSFLPRAIARNIRTDARFAVADIADAYVLPDGSEILVSLKTQAGRADFQYSANAGRTWSGPPSVPIRCSDPGQSAKIQQFGPKATNLAFDCFPTALPNEGLDAGPATTSVRSAPARHRMPCG